MHFVSVYLNSWHSGTDIQGQQAPEAYELEEILNHIKIGTYEQQYGLKEIRTAKKAYIVEDDRCAVMSKEDRKKDSILQEAYARLKNLKDKVPRFTTGGIFNQNSRSEKNLKTPTSLIDIDIDGLSKDELIELREKLQKDKYTYSVFTTCGGDGLCCIFKIDFVKRVEAFEGIANYFLQTYGVALDMAHKNVANTRNVSYDPKLYLNATEPPVFKEYLKKPKKTEVKQLNTFVYAKSDFEECIKQIVACRIDFCPDYQTYRDIGFAVANKFGMLGLEYFDAICQFGEKYSQSKLIKHYKYLCRNPDGRVKVATFFFRCKQLGLEIYSKETKIIASVASQARKSNRSKEDVIKNLKLHEGFSEEQTREIVEQVYAEEIDFTFSEGGILDDIQTYLKHNYSLKLNKITGKFENNDTEWTEADFNSCLVDIKKVFPKAEASWVRTILFSSFITAYNPLKDFFLDNEDNLPKIEGDCEIPVVMKRFWSSVETKDNNFMLKYGTKWMVGAVSTWFGDPSNLELIFAGKLNKGKTWFIMNILPKSLQKYYAQKAIDGSNDCAIMMCQKAIINQNECGGRNKQDEKLHKDLLDKDYFTLRRPYRRDSEDMKRLAALFGTVNKSSDILRDKYGNRRIIVAEILSRDFKIYDAINKEELWLAAYALYKAGYKWRISEEEIPELNAHTAEFEEHGVEYELICKYFEKCEFNDKDNLYYTSSDIKVYIESKTLQKLKQAAVIDELNRLNFEVSQVTQAGMKKRAYSIKLNTSITHDNNTQEKTDMPF